MSDFSIFTSTLYLQETKWKKKKKKLLLGSCLEVMMSSHWFTGSTLVSGYLSVHWLTSRLREATDTGWKNFRGDSRVERNKENPSPHMDSDQRRQRSERCLFAV